MSAPPLKKKIINTYESKSVIATVVLDPETNRKRLKMDHPAYYQHEVDQYAIGDKIHLKMTNEKRLRSEAQNRYMHLYFSLIGMSSGHTTEEVKKWATGKFLTTGIKEIYGEKTRIVKSTTKLTVLECIEFMMEIEEVTGIPCPDPSPFQMSLTDTEWKRLKVKQRQRYLLFKPKVKIKV